MVAELGKVLRYSFIFLHSCDMQVCTAMQFYCACTGVIERRSSMYVYCNNNIIKIYFKSIFLGMLQLTSCIIR